MRLTEAINKSLSENITHKHLHVSCFVFVTRERERERDSNNIHKMVPLSYVFPFIVAR